MACIMRQERAHEWTGLWMSGLCPEGDKRYRRGQLSPCWQTLFYFRSARQLRFINRLNIGALLRSIFILFMHCVQDATPRFRFFQFIRVLVRLNLDLLVLPTRWARWQVVVKSPLRLYYTGRHERLFDHVFDWFTLFCCTNWMGN